MSTAEDLQVALSRCFRYLTIRARTRHEMRAYLIAKQKLYGWEDSIIDAAMKRLDELGYLDDEAFTEMFVRQRLRDKRVGIFVIKRDLERLGVHPDTISLYFDTHGVDEEDTAYRALAPRWIRYQSLEPDRQFQKAAAFLSRKGYSYDIIKKTIAKCRSKG